ncbi:MAG: protein kinase [Gemmatimonadota bacterium]|nr:protein kinase [Gemmatimonadota bacterium]MDH3480050.1 protein kinase [Gemmatimonadota bacterium]
MNVCLQCDTPLPDGSRYCPSCGTDTSDPGTSPRSPQPTANLSARLKSVVGDRYEVRRLLGRGGMGAVFLAVDRKLEREVAIKVLPPELAHDEQFVRRFEHEARTAAKLDHHGIIPIYAVESEDDLHYFVMKYVAGRTLDTVLAAGQVPVDLAQRILWECACALGHAHRREVVHRDIKPANIMLDETGRAMLADFGISKALQSASGFTATGQVIGTPHYMSPEQAKGEDVGGASDQYSLAVVGYRLLSGRLPFEDDSVHTVIYKQVFEVPPPIQTVRADIPAFLASAIHRALEKDPDDRFPTMEAFATAVWPENPVTPTDRISAATTRTRRSTPSTDAPTEISQPTATVGRPRPRPRKRRIWPAIAAALVLVLGGGAAFVGLTPTGHDLLERATRLATRSGQPTGGPGGAPAQPESAMVLAAAESMAAQLTATDTGAAPADTQPTPVRQSPPVQEPARRPSRPVERIPPAPQVGYLSIDATPSGLLVVDGREIRDTPVIRLELARGEHVVEIRREGFQTFNERMMITTGNETRKRVTLVPEGM